MLATRFSVSSLKCIADARSSPSLARVHRCFARLLAKAPPCLTAIEAAKTAGEKRLLSEDLMNTNNAKIEHFQDNLLREVVVNYSTKSTQRFHFNKPEQVAEFARSVLIDNSREHFIALYLNTRHVVIGYSLLAIGTANMVSIHPREIYHRALLAGAFAFVVVHNHPSNELEPSTEDCNMTEVLIRAPGR